MSDVQARPAASRGRGSGRGGRGGLAGRGGRSGGRPNGHSHAHDKAESKTETDNPSAFDDDDQGAIGELKKLYGSKTPLIKEMFPDWSEVDILFALQETDGDETEAATRIAEGTCAPLDAVALESSSACFASALCLWSSFTFPSLPCSTIPIYVSDLSIFSP